MSDPRERGPAACLVNAQRETSAGGVVFRREGRRPLFLLIRDSYDNWGFPKGHLHAGEEAAPAALREVSEETGIRSLSLRSPIDIIEWRFRFRGRLIHKVCHFFLLETDQLDTSPQRAEGITECRWLSYEEARSLISYENARAVLARAEDMVAALLNGSEPEGSAA